MTTANVTERTGAVAMVIEEQGNLVQVERVLVDASDSGKPFAEAIQAIIGAAVEVVKRSELQTCKLMLKRWVVERTFGWLNTARRLSKDYEYWPARSEAWISLVMLQLMVKRLARGQT